MKFKVGDKVICLRSYGMTARLKQGNEYTVRLISNTDDMILVDNIDLWLANERFVLATDASRLLYGKDKV